MKILFICSGKGNGAISPVIENQINILKKYNQTINVYTIEKKGLKGYLQSIIPLRKKIMQTQYDVLHSHYLFCGIVAFFSSPNANHVLSIMGSDIYAKYYYKYIIRLLSFFNKKIIFKSEKMKIIAKIEKSSILPNGIDLSLFKPISQKKSIKHLGWKKDEENKIKFVLFASDSARLEKNFHLAKEACIYINEIQKDYYFDLKSIGKVKHQDMPIYINAADILLLTSQYEGSPNVIKEAMACNTSIVTTDVGDVREILKGTNNCIVSNMNKESIGKAILKVANSFDVCNARKRIRHLKLDDHSFFTQLISIYG